MMPETDMAVATMVAERIRRRIASEPFAIQQGRAAIDVTISIGIAALGRRQRGAILKRADQALYRPSATAATGWSPTPRKSRPISAEAVNHKL